MTRDRVPLFLPSARSAPEAPALGAPALLARECVSILGRDEGIEPQRTGVVVWGDAIDAMRLNLASRLAQRVLWPLVDGPYASEDDLYRLARRVPWPRWITPDETLRVDTTAQRSPLTSLNFASLRIKDAVCDVVREATGARPSVDTREPHLALALHLTPTHALLYADTSGAPLFKRGWRDARAADEGDDDDDGDAANGRRREVHGEAPLKETLAAQMLAAAGWDARAPLLDPMCGAGTIAIEAAQLACGMAPGLQRRFAFERLRPWREHLSAWHAIKRDAQAAVHAPTAEVHASDVSPRMVELAKANARRAGVAQAITFTQGDALRRPPPDVGAVDGAVPTIVTNPPFGQRIGPGGEAEGNASAFAQGLATHWKQHYAGWRAFILSPDPDFERQLRLKASARVPMWNGSIECRLLRLDLVAGTMRR